MEKGALEIPRQTMGPCHSINRHLPKRPVRMILKQNTTVLKIIDVQVQIRNSFAEVSNK